jgi:hypothetical protein
MYGDTRGHQTIRIHIPYARRIWCFMPRLCSANSRLRAILMTSYSKLAGIVKGASVWRQRGALNVVWPQRHGPEHDRAQSPCEFDSAMATDCFFGQVQVRVCFMRLTAGSAFFSTVWPHGCVRASLAATASPSSCLACTRHT